MKKTLLFFICLVTLTTFSQKKDKSSSFNEPEGWCKLVQLKNYNTCFLEFTKKEGIKVVLYDSLRKKIGSGKLQTKMIEDKLGYYILSGIYEISGDVVIFFQKGEDHTPVMLRLIIDGKTGKLKSEEKIAELNKINMKDAFGVVFAGVDMPDIRIVKDPESDYYAMIRYNTLASETSERIEVFHFSPDHKLMNRGFYTSPDNKYKYTKYLNAYVHKDEYVVIATYAFNTKKTGGEEARYYISQLSKGKPKVAQKELPVTTFYKYPSGKFVYNKEKKLIHLILITDVFYEKGSGILKYVFNFQNFTPSTLSLEKLYSPDFSQVHNYYQATMGNKNDFGGILQGTFVDKDGNLVLMFQATTLKYSNGMITGTFLGDVALLTISPFGKTINSAVFPYYSYVSGNHSGYNSDQIKTGFKPAYNFDDKGLASEQYFYMDLVSTDKASYLLFNNTMENTEVETTKDTKLMKRISGTLAVKYTYTGEAVKKDYLFGKPKDKKKYEFCNFSSSSFNPMTKSYATIFTNPETKKSAVVWIKLE